jgi:hypothetical protein
MDMGTIAISEHHDDALIRWGIDALHVLEKFPVGKSQNHACGRLMQGTDRNSRRAVRLVIRQEKMSR